MIAKDNLSQSLTELILYYVKHLEKCQQIVFPLKGKSFTVHYILRQYFTIWNGVVCISAADNKLFCYVNLFMPDTSQQPILKKNKKKIIYC